MQLRMYVIVDKWDGSTNTEWGKSREDAMYKRRSRDSFRRPESDYGVVCTRVTSTKRKPRPNKGRRVPGI